MLQWLTMTICLAATILFVTNRFGGRLPGPVRVSTADEAMKNQRAIAGLIRVTAGAAAGAAVFAALYGLWPSGAFPVSLAVGELVCLADDLIHRRREFLLEEICLYLGSNMVWAPLWLCGGSVYRYGVYFALLALCLVLMVIYLESEGGWIHLQVQSRTVQYLVICLPAAVLVPEILILIACRPQTSVLALLTSTAFLLLYILTLWLQQELLRRVNAEELNRIMSRWQIEARDYMNTIRSQRHDFNLHVHALSGLIGSEKYDECRQYLEKLVSDTAAVNDIMPVKDAVVGSMLYNMRKEARRRGSDIIYNITYDMEDILCNGFECNKIIGNLLQNALDALKTPEDLAYGIHMSILKRRGYTVITSQNRFTGDRDQIARVFEPGWSTKKGHEGIGLSMVMRTAEQYGGRVYPEFEEDMIRFVVNIPNRINL